MARLTEIERETLEHLLAHEKEPTCEYTASQAQTLWHLICDPRGLVAVALTDAGRAAIATGGGNE